MSTEKTEKEAVETSLIPRERYLLKSDKAFELYNYHAARPDFGIYSFSPTVSETASLHEYRNITEYLFGREAIGRKGKISRFIDRITASDSKKPQQLLSDYEIFRCLCNALPTLAGSRIYDCIRLAISVAADDSTLPSSESCDMLWLNSSENILSGKISRKSILSRFRVQTVFSEEDPAFLPNSDTLEKASERLGTHMLPAFYPDRLFRGGARDGKYISSLSISTNTEIKDIESLKEAYRRSLDAICLSGCKTAVHQINVEEFSAVNPNKNIAEKYFASEKPRFRSEEDKIKAAIFKTEMLRFFANEYSLRGIVMQIHMTEEESNDDIFNFKFSDGFEQDCPFALVDKQNIPLKTKFYTSKRILDVLGEENRLPKLLIDFSDLSTANIPHINMMSSKPKNIPTPKIFAAVLPDDTVCAANPTRSAFMPYSDRFQHIEPPCKGTDILSLISHDRYIRTLCNAAAEFSSERKDGSECAKKVIERLCGGSLWTT